MALKIPQSAVKYFEEQDRLYPNRHKEIHKGYCKWCPTNNGRKTGVPDPETEDLKRLPKDILAKEYAFVCAWRPDKLCKGICDEFGIDEQFIKQCYAENSSTENTDS